MPNGGNGVVRIWVNVFLRSAALILGWEWD